MAIDFMKGFCNIWELVQEHNYHYQSRRLEK